MTIALWQLDATALSQLTRSGAASCREAVQSALDRLHAVNPMVNAITLALDESALAQADAADTALRAGMPPGALFGVPFTTKINTDHVGCPTDDGLVNFAKVMPKEDSPLVARLRAAGGIAIGRNNSPAFGLSQNTGNLLHGTTYNPWDRSIMCGGSSGGAAVAVATGIGPIAQGNDLGGSLRWPAFCNGVVGLRPSPGLIPYYNSSYRGGMIFCEQLMTVHGPITRTVRDARLALSVMSGVDWRDPTTVAVRLAGVSGQPGNAPRRVAMVTGGKGVFAGQVHPAISAAVRRAGAHLAAAGYAVEEVEPPLMNETIDTMDIICGKELGNKLMPLLDRFQDPHMAAMVTGIAGKLAHIDLDAFMAALRERDHLIRQWQQFMLTYPLVLLPPGTQPALAVYPAEGLQAAVMEAFHALRSLRIAPLLGFPALAVPVSITPETFAGRPLGVQIMAGRYREGLLLEAGGVIEVHEGARLPIDPASQMSS